MMMRSLLLALCLLVSGHSQASDNVFLGKVIDVDGHNVMKVGDTKGNLRIVTLAYISTPVRHEPYFSTVNEHLLTYRDQWFQFTIAAYGRNAQVKPVLMRDLEQKSINSYMIKNGLAMVNLATNPPVALIDQALEASNQKTGLWGQDEKFNPLDRTSANSFDFTKMLTTEGKNGLVPYIKDPETMNAYPVVCAFLVRGEPLPMALTAHVAIKEGYEIKENCDDLIAAQKSPK